ETTNSASGVCTVSSCSVVLCDSPPTEIYTLSLHDALPISGGAGPAVHAASRGGSRPGGVLRGILLLPPDPAAWARPVCAPQAPRSEEHTSELQSRENLVCRLLLEKKKTISIPSPSHA